MGAFGERLRREREMRGVSLEEIAAVTKIGTRLLRALEEENFEQLPGGIFNKSYVRAYCKCVGLDEETGVADYLEASGETAPDVRLIAKQNASARAERPVSRGGSFPIVPVLVLLVAVAGATGGWHIWQQRRHEQSEKASLPAGNGTVAPVQSTADAPHGAPAKRQTSREQISNAGTSVSANVPSPASQTHSGFSQAVTATSGTSAGAPFEVTVRAKDSAWVSVQADGKILVRGIIKAPDTKTIHASNEVVLWTGNAGATEVSFNGKQVPLSGGPNEERELVFNSQGLQPTPASQ